MTTIGQVVDRDIQRVARAFKAEDVIEYLDISSIDNKCKIVTGTTRYVLKDAPSRAQYVLKQGDILYSTVRPNLQNTAINPYDGSNIVGSTGFCVLRCNNVIPGYIWGVITSDLFTNNMVSLASGANYPAVTDKVVLGFEIPLPLYEEQNRFAEFVKQTDKSKFVLEVMNSNRNLSRCLVLLMKELKSGNTIN